MEVLFVSESRADLDEKAERQQRRQTMDDRRDEDDGKETNKKAENKSVDDNIGERMKEMEEEGLRRADDIMRQEQEIGSKLKEGVRKEDNKGNEKRGETTETDMKEMNTEEESETRGSKDQLL